MKPPMTYSEKQRIRYSLIFTSFAYLMCVPLIAFVLLYLGVDPSPAAGIIGTSLASFSAIIVAFFATKIEKDT